MDYIQGIARQTEIFLYSLGFGFILGIVYDIFRTLRLIVSKSKGFAFFCDILYFALCSFATFCFILVADGGRVRLYVAAGEILGWLIWYFSFGSIALRVTNAIIRFFKQINSLAIKFLKRIIKPIFNKCRRFLLFVKKIMRKNNKKSKFFLQKHRGLVYNLYSYIINKRGEDR